MKLYAQHGFGEGSKVTDGIDEGLIQGVIYSPRDLKPETVRSRMETLSDNGSVDILLDPQFYASLCATDPSAKLGKLTEWEFFRPYRRAELEGTHQVDAVLGEHFTYQLALPVTAVVAPNVYISRSFDSIEAAIAKSFVRRAAQVYRNCGGDRPLYVSILVSAEALLQNRELDMFLNDLTAVDDLPNVYLVVGCGSTESRMEVYHPDVIGGWMLMNYAFSLVGLDVVNGYSDVLSPLLGIAGGAAGATGWWSNLRMFSMERFVPNRTGGSLPVVRYLSCLLMNRITFEEKERFGTFAPSVTNGLPHDADYAPHPERAGEILQSWEALQSLLDELVSGDLVRGLLDAEAALAAAEAAYNTLRSEGVDIHYKSSDSHIRPMREGIEVFRRRAEI